MASKKPPKAAANIADTDDMPAETKALKAVHERALKRYKKVCDDPTERENREKYREDMLFTYKPGEQWKCEDKKDRGDDRPMYEFNETRVSAMSVINHIRANRPAAKIRGVEESDKELAEIRQGLYLNITNNSDFDSIKDYAAGHQVAGGMGAWRIDTEYSDDTAFDQDIVIRNFIDPMCLRADPSDRDELKRKANYWFVETKVTNEDYETRWPKADRVDFQVDDELDPDTEDDSTWVAEYWEKVPTTKNICLLSDGKTIEKKPDTTLPQGVTVVKEKQVKTHKIVQYIISGEAVLEGPNDWAGSMFPFVPVYGYYIVINGKPEWGGLTRYAKDAQRALNWAMTSVYETIGNASQSKYWATAKQANGLATQWAEANKKNYPAQIYNHDPDSPGPPSHMGGADVPAALIGAAAMARDGLKSSLGIFNASLGATSNETSGRAIRARQDEGMVATFNFGDNMAKSERRTCEIVNDLEPKIYDTKRTIRILGQDQSEKFVILNDIDPVTGEVLNDMSAGKFDYVVTTGPSYATQRQEAQEFFTAMAQADPGLMGSAADLVYKMQDSPMSDAIAERRRLLLPAPIQQAISKDKPLPPEVQAAMAQVDQMQQQIQQQGQLLQQAQGELQGQQADAVKAKSQVEVSTSNLKIAQARFEVDVANFKTWLAQQEAAQAIANTGKDSEVEKATLSGQLEQALGKIQQESAQIMAGFAQSMAQMQASSQPHVIVPPAPPAARVKHIERVNGRLVPVYEDQTSAAPMPPANGVQ